MVERVPVAQVFSVEVSRVWIPGPVGLKIEISWTVSTPTYFIPTLTGFPTPIILNIRAFPTIGLTRHYRRIPRREPPRTSRHIINQKSHIPAHITVIILTQTKSTVRVTSPTGSVG